MWVRHRKNFPLTAATFKDIREENIDRVVQLARDHYTFVPDNEFTNQVLWNRIRLKYNGYRSELSSHYRNKCRNDYEFALANPPTNCTNMEDWTSMCKHFSSEEFRKKSALASQYRKKTSH